MMKILSVAWSIYDDRIKEFSANYTGGGVVIKNLCEYIGRNEKSYLFIGAFKIPAMRLGNINIVDTISLPSYIDNSLEKNEHRLQEMEAAFELTLERLSPDIVNFHGKGILAKRCIDVCCKRNVPYVYTEHLYIGMEEKIVGYNLDIEWEKGIFSTPGIQVIAVSNGMKKKILGDWPQLSDDCVKAISNGTDFHAERIDSNLIKQYKLQDSKILLCVGTVLERKNQLQLVSSFQLLPQNIQRNLKIIICGKDKMAGKLQQEISDNGLDDKIIYAGAFPGSELKKYYTIADGLIMPSLAEGLSIAALEAISYGIPVIMFSDSECADDLNDERVVCFAKQRSDICLAKSMEEWFFKEWDKNYIIDYSKYFSMERMAKDYIAYYKKRLKDEEKER